MDNILRKIDKDIEKINVLENIEKNIQKLDKNQNIILYLGGGIESFFLATLLKKHFNKNLYCVLLNTPCIDEEEFSKIMYEYYNSGIKVIAINCREYFYKLYIMNNNEQSKIIEGYNKIFSDSEKFIDKDINYISFGFTQEKSNINDLICVEKKEKFEPFLELNHQEIIEIIKNRDLNKFFIEKNDYWLDI